jgi:oligopeptide transport system substrate-binding protein
VPRWRAVLFGVVCLVLAISVGTVALTGTTPRPPETPVPGAPVAGTDRVRIVSAAPSTWDPAVASSANTAAVLAQVFEGLTAFDAESQVRPALAQSWRFGADGTRLEFQLRPGIVFSDGTPIRAQDVVDSWLRLIDPQRPSPLSSLVTDIKGAREYLAGTGPRGDVGLRAEGDRVLIEFRRPASYFVSVTASPSLAVVPPGTGDRLRGPDLPRDIVVSGAYTPTAQDATTITLAGNPRYWGGTPPIPNVTLITDLEGASVVEAFEDGRVDYTNIAAADASWIRYDSTLGPRLRRAVSFSVDYYGFDTTKPPFDDARVRQAFAKAVDWRRLVQLANPEVPPATSLVPPGIAGRGEGDFSVRHDPAGAKRLLADAGFPDGRGFPTVTLVTSGYTYDDGIRRELRDVLGIEVDLELMEFDPYFTRLEREVPQFWALSWIADYPAPQDFLGLLLETGASTNYGRWSDAAYDTAIEAASRTTDLAQQEQQYAAAQRIVQEQVPVIPVSYGGEWALAREGLQGATESGVGFLRFAGLAWAP